VEIQLRVVATKEGHAMVSLVPPNGTSRTPTDLCCVVDTSMSMGEDATLKNESGKVETYGLCILDIVKHAVKTIISSLEDSDRLSLVIFSNTARTVFDLMSMNEEGKKRALVALGNLSSSGQTNLWDGLHTGLEILRNASIGRKNTALLLLTDGEPNIVPPRGHLPMLQKYKNQHKQLPSVHTFGFGYVLDSVLLNELAAEGNGTYSFIPDSSLVGTVFVNSLSNLLTTVASNVTLSIEPLNGAKFVDSGVLGYPSQNISLGKELRLSTVKYSQSQDVVLHMSFPKEETNILWEGDPKPYLRATLTYDHVLTGNTIVKIVEGVTPLQDGTEIEKHHFRLLFVDGVHNAMQLMKKHQISEAQALINQLIRNIQNSSIKDNPFIVDLLKDLEGQTTEAFSREDWYTRWGRHYLPSLVCAHLLQQCNNFKDPGVQHYGGPLFSQIRDKVDDTFCKLPPPKASKKSRSSHTSNTTGHTSNTTGHTSNTTSHTSTSNTNNSGSSSSPRTYYTPSPVLNMNVYHDSSVPCFAGDSTVLMADGSIKPVKEIHKGDSIRSIHGKDTTVHCVVKTHCQHEKTQLVQLEGGLLITPYHPVKIDSRWCFPCDISRPVEMYCPAVFSFVLDTDHIMIINGVECITLGHGFDAVRHPYFGTDCVLKDLNKMSGWDVGLVELRSGCMVHDENTGLVSGMRQN